MLRKVKKGVPAEPTRVLSDHVIDAREAHDDLWGMFSTRAGELELRIKELESDFLALAELLGNHFGEPIKSKAQEIAFKRQTK